MATITLPARCDRGATEAILPEFVEAMGGGPIEVDASRANHIGFAMLQLLASARTSIDDLRITPSPALTEAARLTGLSAHLFDEAH